MSLEIHLTCIPESDLAASLFTEFQTYHQNHPIPGKKRKRVDAIGRQAQIAMRILLKLIKLGEHTSLDISLSKRRLDRKKTRYDNPQESYKNVHECVSLLVAIDLIRMTMGTTEFRPVLSADLESNKVTPFKKIPTKLTQGPRFADFTRDIDPLAIYKDPVEKIQIREAKKTASRNAKNHRKSINYTDTQAIKQLRENLTQIDAHLSQYQYQFEGKPIPYRPLYRVFHEDIHHWGRIENNVFEYSSSRASRSGFTINGEKLGNIDFHAFTLATHSVLQGHCIDGIEDLYQKGRLERLPREFVKVMIQKILNQPPPISRLYSGGRQLLKDVRSPYKKDKTHELIEMMNQEHPVLRSFPDCCLINYEARLQEHILLACVQHNIPVIPLYDGVYTPDRYLNRLEVIVNHACLAILGQRLPYKILNSDGIPQACDPQPQRNSIQSEMNEMRVEEMTV
jgi:hypothetical protein